MSLFSPYTVDGVRYSTAREVQRAKRRKALEGIASNTGIRNRLWNFFAKPSQKKQAADDLASMRNGGNGYREY